MYLLIWTSIMTCGALLVMFIIRSINARPFDQGAVEVAIVIGVIFGWLSYFADPKYPKKFFDEVKRLFGANNAVEEEHNAKDLDGL